MGTPYILTLLSAEGYQVFAALHREFETLDDAIEGAKSDYLRRYGGSPAFRVYQAEPDKSGCQHTLIEACFDESKRRSFVALYKILREARPATNRLGPARAASPSLRRSWIRDRAQPQPFVRLGVEAIAESERPMYRRTAVTVR